MANELDKIAKSFVDSFRATQKKKTSAYDSQATVVRVEENIAWVHIPGGVDETPAQMTMSASVGDLVQVRVSGGRAWLTGNATAPPTDDRMAIVANEAAQTAVSLTNITHASLETLDAKVAVIDSAYIDTATVNTLLAGYAQITLANIDTANINKGSIKDLFTAVGLITSATIVDGKITGYLDAVNVNCNNITAGTLVADRIAIRGSNQSLVYALNNYGQITSQQVNTIDGYILTERTVNADRIVAGSITANEIAASTITANKMNVTSLSSVSANIGTVTAGILTSEDWSYTSGIYPTAGMRISLNDKYIRTPDFAVVGGKVYAKGGDLAGWTINDYQIANYDEESTSTQYGVFVRAKESNGPATANTYHFGVYHRDYSGGSYGAWTMDFGVKHDGSLYSTKGTIGPWTLDGNSIYRGGGYNSSTANSMYFGTSGLSVKNKFVVDPDGNVYCKGGTLHLEDISSSDRAEIIFPTGYLVNLGGGTRFHDDTHVAIDAGNGVSGQGSMTITAWDFLNLTGSTEVHIITSGAIYLSGNTSVSGTLQTSDNINLVSTATSACAVGVQNAVKKVQLYMASNGQMGVYNATDTHYVICEDADNVIRMPQVYAKTNSGAANIYIDSYGRTYRSTASSKRYKKNIKPLEDWKSILDIPVVSFMYREGYVSKDDQRYGVSVPGLIAEDVAEHYAVAAENPNGKVEDWNIRYIVPPMLAVEQDHERRIAALEEKLRREAV